MEYYEQIFVFTILRKKSHIFKYQYRIFVKQNA